MKSIQAEMDRITIIDGISSEEDFYKLCRILGSEISQIENLEVKSKNDAKRFSQSRIYGKGEFPFHTDYAWESKPARFIALRAVSGDFSRNTYYKSFDAILKGLPDNVTSSAIFKCELPSQNYYLSLRFKHLGKYGFRYDRNILKPANSHAKMVADLLEKANADLGGDYIEWKKDRVAIIDNWSMLHARGGSLSSNQNRKIQRINIK